MLHWGGSQTCPIGPSQEISLPHPQVTLSLWKVSWRSTDAHTASSLEPPSSCISPCARGHWHDHFFLGHRACPLFCLHVSELLALP